MAKTPSKKSAKAPKKASGKGSKKKRTESYSSYIYSVTVPSDEQTPFISTFAPSAVPSHAALGILRHQVPPGLFRVFEALKNVRLDCFPTYAGESESCEATKCIVTAD